MRQVPIDSVADVCTFVDELDGIGDATGELVVSEQGAVFIEDGRICWAAASGLARRLTELLARCSGVDAATMEGFYRACQSRRAPIGEYLVTEGVVSAEDLRAALAQHTVESLLCLTGEGRRAGWCPRRAARGYSPRFTFGTAEILTRAGALPEGRAARARAAEHEMDACFSPGDWSVAFIRSEARSMPEPIALLGNIPASATALARVASWATSALDVVAAFEARAPLVAVTVPTARRTDPRREVLVAFEHEGLVIVGESSAQCPARILNRRAVARATPRA